jgi:hypothetical protein
MATRPNRASRSCCLIRAVHEQRRSDADILRDGDLDVLRKTAVDQFASGDRGADQRGDGHTGGTVGVPGYPGFG